MAEEIPLDLFDKVIEGHRYMLERKIGRRDEIEECLVHEKAIRDLFGKAAEGLKKDLKAKLLQDLVDEWFGVYHPD